MTPELCASCVSRTAIAELNGARRASDLSAELGVLAPDWRIGNAKHTDEV